MQQEADHSVEEILESIKKVIARDNRQSADNARQKRSGNSTAKAPKSAEANSKSMQEAANDSVSDSANGRSSDTILDLTKVATALNAGSIGAGLTNVNASNSVRESLATLANLAVTPTPSETQEPAGNGLEAIVRDMLRPMLSQWLDANMPAIVEEMVREEVARISGLKD